MQYIWQHRLYPHTELRTVDGRRVQVVDPGRLNTDAGPDFFNAKISIDNQMWAGDVEIHVRASDWNRHGHQHDEAYNSVVLHVVGKDDIAIHRSDGQLIPQIKLPCAADFHTVYESLVGAAAYPSLPCADELRAMEGTVYLRSWIDSLAFERINDKTERIESLLKRCEGDWERVCFIILTRSLGFGVNSEPFERLAAAVPMGAVRKHSDQMMSLEAILFGMAGLIPPSSCEADREELYTVLLRREYEYLKGKFGLQEPTSLGWKMARMRPANFPHRRIAFLAAMLFGGFRLMSAFCAINSIEAARRMFDIELSQFWQSHYSFAPTQPEGVTLAAPRSLSRSSVESLIINAIVPIQYAFGLYTADDALTDRAVELLMSVPAENNSVVRIFADSAGLKCKDAFTSQALVQLRRSYCETRKCLYCRIGHRYLSKHSLATSAV